MSTDVMTNQKTTTKEKKRISTKVIAQIGVLGAIAMVLMLFDIPLPFAPTNPILWLFSIFKDTSFSIRSLPKYLVILLKLSSAILFLLFLITKDIINKKAEKVN